MPVRRPLNVEDELVEVFEQCGRVTEYLVTVVPRDLWYLPSPTGHGHFVTASGGPTVRDGAAVLRHRTSVGRARSR